MDLIGDILLQGRTGRPVDALEKSPGLSMERASSGRYAIAEVIDVDLMDDSVEPVTTTKAGEAFVSEKPDDWGLLIGLAWSLPAGIAAWVIGICLL